MGYHPAAWTLPGLAQLAAKGLVVCIHGGVVLPGVVKNPVAFIRKSTSHAAEKVASCQLAAKQISAGDTIFIDCSSTTFPLCPLIRHLSICMVTNPLPVLFELVGSAAQAMLADGEVYAERQALYGTVVIEQLKRYRVEKAFLGVDRLSLAHGLSANSEAEAAISLTVAGAASYVYLLCDASKPEQDKYFQFAPLFLVNTLITDAGVAKPSGVVLGVRDSCARLVLKGCVSEHAYRNFLPRCNNRL